MFLLRTLIQQFIAIIFCAFVVNLLLKLIKFILYKLIKFLYSKSSNILFKITLPWRIKIIRWYIFIYKAKIREFDSDFYFISYCLSSINKDSELEEIEEEDVIEPFFRKDYQKELLKNNQLFVINETKREFLEQIIKLLFNQQTYMSFDSKTKKMVYNNIFLQNIKNKLDIFYDILQEFKEKTDNKNNIKNIKKEEIEEIKNIFKLVSIAENLFFDLQEFYDKKEIALKKEIEIYNFKQKFKFLIQIFVRKIIIKTMKFINKQSQNPLRLLFIIISYFCFNNKIYYYLSKIIKYFLS